MTTAQNQWIARNKAVENPRARIFCIPFAGGTSAVFRAWQENFPADIEVCPLNLPGRGGRMREPSYRRMNDLLAGMADGITPFLDVPFAVLGHSLGALMAYELTAFLRRNGRPDPVRLFVCGARGAQIPDPYPPIHHLPPDRFVQQMQLRYAGIPAEVVAEPDLLALLLPPLQADLELFETYAYAPQPPLACPISVFGGRRDSRLDREQYQAWQELTEAPIAITMFEGGHFFIQEHGPAVARAAAGILVQSLSGT